MRAVDIAEPAVVRIITQVQSRLTVSFPGAASVTFPQDGSSYPLTLSGSGTFISAHGDILTADHVVNPPHDTELSGGLDSLASQDIANYVNQHSQANGGSQATADQVTQALQSGQLPSTPQYGTTQSIAFFDTSYTGPLTATSLQNLPQQVQMPVDRIEKQSPVDQRDTAIIHVPVNDTPSVQLGSSTGVQQQDELTIIGFPGNADVSSLPTDILTPSINKLIVSATKTTQTGAPVIQVGGNVEQGDSGGPALDSKGNIVGIVSFSIAASGSPGSTNFLQASESAQQLIQSLNLDTSPGTFQKAWSQAFTDYASTTPGHWHIAQAELQKIQDSYPQFKAVTPYLNYAIQQAKSENTTGSLLSTPTSIPALVWIVGVLVLIVLLLLLLGFGLLRRKNSASTNAINSISNGNSGVTATTGYPSQTPQGQIRLPNVPNVPPSASAYGNGLAAFGGPQQATFGLQETTPQPPVTSPQSQPYSAQQAPFVQNTPTISGVTNGSNALQTWPCGHKNRSNARFCNICGAPAPTSSMPPSTNKYEQ
ncbi:MAG TPA: hypothetical protein DHW02_04890 [Ktedonobacter sp.]|nr:hypothetical protein [Ktedonobacter sp.]